MRATRAGPGLEGSGVIVIFFYEQAGLYMRCEVHPRADGASAELIVTQPDGAATVEILSGSEVTNRVTELQTMWVQAGWWGPIGREF
jgi:hypothetical protein